MLRRTLGAVVALFVASLVIFAGTQLLPGDAASVVLGRNGTPENVRLLHKQLHLDKPAWQQYTDWLSGLVHGDLGDWAVGMAQGASSAPIWPLISDPVKNSLILAAITALLMIPLSLGLGVIAAVFRGRWLDHFISIGSLAAIALPEFVIGSLLVGVFFVGLDWLPPVADLSRRGPIPWTPRPSSSCRSRRCSSPRSPPDPHGAGRHGRGAADRVRADGAA